MLKLLPFICALALITTSAYARDPSPDELFPAQSRNSYDRYYKEIERAKREQESIKPKDWSNPSVSHEKVTYQDLDVLNKKVESVSKSVKEIKKKLRKKNSYGQ